MTTQQKIAPCLWFDAQAEEAANFYVSVFPDSHIDFVARTGTDTPGALAGNVILVQFTLAGLPYQALNGGSHVTFNEAISLSVACTDQNEVDRIWDTLTADGGEPVQCGWLKDKYGVRWQIVPEVFMRMMQDSDPDKSRRVMEAMMQMVKFDVADLKRAYDG